LIFRKVPESECSKKLREICEEFRRTFEPVFKCIDTREADTCRKALRGLGSLMEVLEAAADAGCVVDVGDFIDEIKMTLEEIGKILGRAT